MSKKINYKLVKLDFFTDFSKILDKNTNKLLKSYIYSRLVVYNEADYKKFNLLNKCTFLFNMKLQIVLMNQITIHFLLKKYYNLIFSTLLHNSNRIHLPKGSNLSNILEMLNSGAHMQKGGGMKEYVVKFIILISLFFSFYEPVSATGIVPHLPGTNADLSNRPLPDTFTRGRRQEELNREKKKQQYTDGLGRAGGLIATAFLGSLILPGLTGLSEEEMKEKIATTIIELNEETNDIYHLVSSQCDSLVTTLHEKGILDTSSLEDIVPESFENEKTIVENSVAATANAAAASVASAFSFWSTTPKVEGKPEPRIKEQRDESPKEDEYSDLVVLEEEPDEPTLNINSAGTSLIVGEKTSESASRLERFMRQKLDNSKDAMATKYKYLCNAAFKSNIVWGEMDGMFLIRQLNGHVSLVNKDFSMINQLKSFLIVMKSHAEKKIAQSVLYSPDPIYKQIIQKIEIFELIMSNSVMGYFPFDNMQTFSQSATSIRKINERVRQDTQWLQYDSPMDKRTANIKFLEDEEKQRFDVQMQLNTAELRSELEGLKANQVIKENLERAQRIEETTNSTQQYNRAKQREWGEFIDSYTGKNNIFSQFISTTINGGIIEGIFSPLLDNIKKYGYEVICFSLVAIFVLLFAYTLPAIGTAISRSLTSKRNQPEIQTNAPVIQTNTPVTQPNAPVIQTNANTDAAVDTIVLNRLPNDQILQLKYDERGTLLEIDMIEVNRHMRNDTKDKLINLHNYYKQNKNKIILFTFDSRILCGKFIGIQEKKILVEAMDGPIELNYKDIIDPIINPYLTTDYIRERYIECLSTIDYKKENQRPQILYPEQHYDQQLRLIEGKRSMRRRSSSSSSSSDSSRHRRSRHTRKSRR